MKKIRFILFIICFPFFMCNAQQKSDNDILTDENGETFSQPTNKQSIDSLKKYVEAQYYQKNYDKTIEKGSVVVQMAKEKGDTLTILRIASFIGNAFLQSEDTLTARKIFQDNVKLATSFNQANRITATQIDLANFYALTKNASKAIEMYTRTIPFAEVNKDTTSLFILHSNISELNLDGQNIEASAYHVSQMNRFVNSRKSPYFIAGANLLNGRLEFLLKNLTGARTNLKEGIRLAEEIKFNEILIQLYDYLSQVEAELGNFEAAYIARENHQKYLAEKYEQDKITAIENVTAKYKLNEYKRRIEEQVLKNEEDQVQAKKETTIIWIKIASGILFIFLIVVFRAYLNRKKLLKDLQIKNKQYLLAKNESEELSKAKSILFSNMTHELRTPMYGIIGITSILLEDEKFKNEKENLSSLKFSADYLLSLINNVLYFNKIEAAQNEVLAKKEFHIRDLINNVVESAKFLNPDHNNMYSVAIDDCIPEYIIGDYTKISQIVMNLLGNASKFTEQGSVLITLKRNPLEIKDAISIEFIIKDTGIGMSKERQKAVLDSSIEHTTLKSYGAGNGLGFPIVTKILELHDATLQLESEKGVGTSVSFAITFGITCTALQALEIKTIVSQNALENVKILVVDDNRINQLVTQKSLQSYKSSTTIAGSGKEALRLIAENEFDLILMDINMPEMDGFETTERIRKTLSEIPIIALTAVEKEKVMNQEGFGLMNDIIIKPYKGDAFIATILKNLKAQIEN